MNTNFLQRGRTIECGNCHPEKYEDCQDNEVTKAQCDCICHDLIPKDIK